MAVYAVTNEPAAVVFEGLDDNVSRTLQNVKNLIRCRMGEVPYDRYRGLDPALFDSPESVINSVIKAECERVIGEEPDASVTDAVCRVDANGEAHITVWVEIQ